MSKKTYLFPLILITSLFFFWGLIHNLNPVLIPHLRQVFQLTDLQPSFIDSSIYIAYFLMAIPAGNFMQRFGYKKGILLGLSFLAIGAFFFIPAASTQMYVFFLGTLFVLACGLAFLETAANPYVTVLDTKETDYKITSDKTPFSTNPKRDIVKEVFDAFRKDDFMVGAYFSKPDWHSDYYWWRYFPPKDRNVNYDPARYPKRWQNFKQFTYNQINELTSDYGQVDILWLDGGQVQPLPEGRKGFDQDIDMDWIGGMARKNQPGILVVDRTVPSKWENYVTPEQTIPDTFVEVPWESVISMGDSFSYVPDDNYKSPQKIINSLIEIVAKGGAYLLNIGPGPDGDFDPVAYDRLEAIGKWMDINGTAIYKTRPVAPYYKEQFYYTQSKDGKTLNVFHTPKAVDQDYVAPEYITFTIPDGFKPKTLKILGLKSKNLKWKQKGNKIELTLPKTRKALEYATVIQLTK